MTYMSTLAQGLLVLLHIYSVSSRCSEEQSARCRNAGKSGSIPSLSEAGECQALKQGDPLYTSACTVAQYVDGVDSCCCAYLGNAQCCRYHYAHADFFCEGDDIVGPSDNTEDVSDKTDDVSDKTEDVSDKTEDVSDKTEDVSDKTEDVSDTTEDVSDKTEDVSDNTEDVSDKTEDVSDKTEDVSVLRGQDCVELKIPPVWVVCVSIIVPLAVIAFIAYCAIKCYQGRHKLRGDDENTRRKRNSEASRPAEDSEAAVVLLPGSETNNSATNTPEHTSTNHVPVIQVDAEAPPPKATPLPATSGSCANEMHRLPSAPPISDEEEEEARDSLSEFSGPRYSQPMGLPGHPAGVHRNFSEPGDISASSFHGAEHPMFRRYSESETAPPSYEESLTHPPFYSE